MDVAMLQYPPGDPRMIDTIVHQLKSQGIFDQFRKECIADVDTKPAYQNLHQRVEGTVSGFLAHQVWRPDLNKNQVRESLRKHIHESGYLDLGVERIVDQVVNPKIMTVLVPQVEDVVYKFIGIEKPKKAPINHMSIAPKDLLPKDLDPVSPESDVVKKSPSNSVEEGEFDEKDGGTPPPFSTLETSNDNSMGSHLSGISGLTSPDDHLSNISYIGGKTPPRKCQEGDSNLSKVSLESMRSLSAMEIEHSEAYNQMELDAPTTYERMAYEKPSHVERAVSDKPSSFDRTETEKHRNFQRTEADKPPLYERMEADKPAIVERAVPEKQKVHERIETERRRSYEEVEAERRRSYEGMDSARRGSCSESETEYETSSDEESSPEHEPLDGSMSPINALHNDLDRMDIAKAAINIEGFLPKTESKLIGTGDAKAAPKDSNASKEKQDSVEKEPTVKEDPKVKPKEVEEKNVDKQGKKSEKEDLKTLRKESEKTDKDVKKSVKDGSTKKEEKKKESDSHARKSDKDKDGKRYDKPKKDEKPKDDTKKEDKLAKKSEKVEKDDAKKEEKPVKKDDKSKRDEKGGRKVERRSSHSSHRSSHHSKPRKPEEDGKKKSDDGRKKEEDAKKKGDEVKKKEEDPKKKSDEVKKKEEYTKKKSEDVKKKEDDAKKKGDDGKRKEDDAKKKKDSHKTKNGKSDRPATSKDKESKDSSGHRRERDGSKSDSGRERKDPSKDKDSSQKDKDPLSKDKDSSQKDKDPMSKDKDLSQKEKERREKERKSRDPTKRKKAVDDHRGHRERRSEDRRSADGDSNGTARDPPRSTSASAQPRRKEGQAPEQGGQSGGSGGNSEQAETNRKAAKGSEHDRHKTVRRLSVHGSCKRSPDEKVKASPIQTGRPEDPPSPELRFFPAVDDSELRGFTAFLDRLEAAHALSLAAVPRPAFRLANAKPGPKLGTKRGRPALATKSKAMGNAALGLKKTLIVKVEQLVFKSESVVAEAGHVSTEEKPASAEPLLSVEGKKTAGETHYDFAEAGTAESAAVKCEVSECSEVNADEKPMVSQESGTDVGVHDVSKGKPVNKPKRPARVGSKTNDQGAVKEIHIQLSKEHDILYGGPSELAVGEPENEQLACPMEVLGEDPVLDDVPAKEDTPVVDEIPIMDKIPALDDFPVVAKRQRLSADMEKVLAEKKYESRDFTVEADPVKPDANCTVPPKEKVYESRDLTTSSGSEGTKSRPPSSAESRLYDEGPRSRPVSRADSRAQDEAPKPQPLPAADAPSSVEPCPSETPESVKGPEGSEMRPPTTSTSPGGAGRRSRQPSTRYSASDYSLTEAEVEGEEPVKAKGGRKRSWPRLQEADNNNERIGGGVLDKGAETMTGGQDDAAQPKKPKVGRPRGRPPGTKKIKDTVTETKLALTDGRGKARVATPTFVMPLSPESDVSASSAELANRKAPSVSPTPAPTPTATRRATPAASSRAQRYSSDDLYKPRPLFSRGRRARGPQNDDGQT